MRILLQTTIPSTSDDWSIVRFSMLHRLLAECGHEVTSANRIGGIGAAHYFHPRGFAAITCIPR